MLILMVPLIGIHSYISVSHALSEWEIGAEAQFEFAKFLDKLQKEIEFKHPQKITEYKNVILQLLPDFRETINRLDPVVNVEFRKLASTSSEFPLDCNSVGQQLPLPTPLIDQTRSTSDSCFASEGVDSYLQIQCNEKKISNATKLDNQGRGQLSDRAKERLNVGCDALVLLSNKTQNILKSMNKDVGSCFSNVSSGT